MIFGNLIFTTAIVRKTQSYVCGSKTRITLQRFCVSGTGLTLLTLLVKCQAFYISLFGAARALWIGNRSHSWFEIGIAIDGHIRAVFNKVAAVFTLESYHYGPARCSCWQGNRSAECLRRIQINAF